jgi:hypothetical protein
MQVFNKPDKVFHVNEDDDSEFIVAKLHFQQPYVMILFKVGPRLYKWKGGKDGRIFEWGTSTSKIAAIKRFYTQISYGFNIEFYIINNFEDLVKVIGADYA